MSSRRWRELKHLRLALLLFLAFLLISSPILSADSGRIISTIKTEGATRSLLIRDEYAFIGARDGLGIVDISDVDKPKIISEIKLKGEVLGISISGNTLFAAVYRMGLVIIDVSHPGFPQVKEVYEFKTAIYNLLVAGSLAYVASSQGLIILDISDKFTPREIGLFETESAVYDICINGDWAYILDNSCVEEYQGRLYAVDISDPRHPKPGSQLDLPFPMKVVAVDNYLYVADGGLYVFDISAPSQPKKCKAIFTGDIQQDLAIDQTNLFVVEKKGLHIFDITNPKEPVKVNSLTIPDSSYRISVRDQNVFIANYYEGLLIIGLE